MKKFVLSCLIMFFCLPVVAEEIELKEKRTKSGEPGSLGNKNEYVVPSASIEDGVITIGTELASWGVTVTVYNGDDAVVYTSTSATEGKTHVFTVGELAEGDYVLEVELGEDLYEGLFSM